MKQFLSYILLFACSLPGLSAPGRVVKGTVSRDGKPASGVLVTVHKSKSSYFTSFDGKYEVKTKPKSRWISFASAETETKKELDPNGSDYLDVQLTSEKKELQTALPESGEHQKKKRKKK